MPLMKRTVRDESGAWSFANIAPVRASDTATSGDRSSVPGRAYTPTMLPVRSTTAAASVSSFSAVATTVSTARTSSAVRIWAGPPALAGGVFVESRAVADTRISAAVAADVTGRTQGF